VIAEQREKLRSAYIALPAISEERRWVLAFGLVVMLFTSLPYLLGFSTQGDAWRFTGFVFAVEDGNSYIAKMLTGSVGSWLFRSPYTTAPQTGVIALLPYILLGKLAAAPGLHEQLVAIFHLFRIATGCLVLLATYDFLSFYFTDVRQRRWGLVLAALGGGLGWVLVLLGQTGWLDSLPLEYYSPETFGFLALYGLPHLSLARAAMLWGLLIYLRAEQGDIRADWRAAIRTGMCWLLAALCQPLAALVMGIVLGLHLLARGLQAAWQSRRSKSSDWGGWCRLVRFVVLSALIPAPFLLYNALAFSLDPYLKAWTAQNLILSPPFPHYLLAYGLLIPFLPLGARGLLRAMPQAGWLPLAWVLASPFLAYAPVNLQRRLVEGVWVALIIISMYAVQREGQRGVSWRTFQAATLLLFPSTILLLAGGLLSAARPAYPLFRPADEAAVFEYIARNASPGMVVLASYESGNALPAWVPVRVLIGHGPESADLANLRPQVMRFFQPETSEADRRALLSKHQVAFLLYGPSERALGAWDPSQQPYLENIFQSGSYVLYRTLE